MPEQPRPEAGRELLELIAEHPLGQADALDLLQRHFPNGSMPTDRGRVVDFKHQADGGAALSLRFNKKGVVSDLSIGPAWTDDDRDGLRDLLTGDRPTRFGSTVLFSFVPVTGICRVGDILQIRPVPDGSPEPSMGFGGYPLLLEFSYNGSEDQGMDLWRCQRQGRKLSRMLAAFLPSVEHDDAQTRFEWVLRFENPDQISSEYLQLGYTHEPIDLSEGFTSPGGVREIERQDPTEYYNAVGYSPADALKAPESLERLIEAYLGLEGEEAVAAERWAYWLNHAGQVWGLSPSAAHVAVLQAVESLARPIEPRQPCPECELDTSPGPTARVRAFLEAWIPTNPDERGRGGLYSLRSGITHGEVLFAGALSEESVIPFTPLAQEQRTSYSRALLLARLSGLNWLLSRGA